MANDVAVATLPPQKKLRTKEGRTICYREAGSGTPLVLVHGIGSRAFSWEAQLASAALRYRVIAWDAPGYGESDPFPDEKPKAEDYAHALAALLDGLGIKQAHVVGHSLGAIMAGSFARLYPDRVLSLVLASPARGYGNATAEMREQKLRERLDVLDSVGPQGMAEKRSHVLVAPNARPEALAKVKAAQASINPHGYRQAVYMLNGADLREDGPKIKARTLVMCGSADVVTPEKGCQMIADSVPGARYASLPGLGHCFNIEDPAAFDAVLYGFIGA
jgi:pimeloyl-ACP methyl ester carboxylesterase